MHIGLIGGIGPAATEYYYRGLIARHTRSGTPLELTIAHADVRELAQNLANNDARKQADIFVRLVRRLAAAGAGAVAVTSMGGHFCITELEAISPLPMPTASPVNRDRATGIERSAFSAPARSWRPGSTAGSPRRGLCCPKARRSNRSTRTTSRWRSQVASPRRSDGLLLGRAAPVPGAGCRGGRSRRHGSVSRIRRTRLRISSDRLRRRPRRSDLSKVGWQGVAISARRYALLRPNRQEFRAGSPAPPPSPQPPSALCIWQAADVDLGDEALMPEQPMLVRTSMMCCGLPTNSAPCGLARFS